MVDDTFTTPLSTWETCSNFSSEPSGFEPLPLASLARDPALLVRRWGLTRRLAELLPLTIAASDQSWGKGRSEVILRAVAERTANGQSGREMANELGVTRRTIVRLRAGVAGSAGCSHMNALRFADIRACRGGPGLRPCADTLREAMTSVASSGFGLLETWNERDGTLRGWLSYAAPVNGWEGGWYAMTEVRSDDGDSPNNDGRTWSDVATR